MAYVSNSGGRRKISFYANDLLLEAISEFLQSGAQPTKFVSCIIKIATATELLIKAKLEKLCPALVLDRIDDEALHVAKVFGLSKKLRNPSDLDHISVKTVSFPKLLCRAAKFFDLSGFQDGLARLHKIRNELIHHAEEIDIDEVNLLLITKIFPFLEEFTKDDKLLTFTLKPETWEQFRKLAESSSDAIATEISKKLAYHAEVARKLSASRITALSATQPEARRDEEIIETDLLCPACRNESLSSYSGWDVDYDDGLPVGAIHFSGVRCRVCGLELDQDEMEAVVGSFERFFGKDYPEEKAAWKNAIAEPDYSDMYDPYS